MNIEIHLLNEIAIEAGEQILTYYKDEMEVQKKVDKSPLTKADIASHNVIIKGLQKHYPEIPIISEESEIPEYEERKSWDTFFLVDPLDGTKEFIKKNGEFTVNIALIKNNKPELGVVYIPAEKILYYADKQAGAFKKTGDQPAQKIEHKPYQKSKPARIMVSRSHNSGNTKTKLLEMGIEVSDEIPSGSSLKFCLVAEGKADLYPRFGPTMEWDTAAADAVFRFSGKNGERKSPLIYNKKSLKNPEFIIGL